jgi:hypothetical protein
MLPNLIRNSTVPDMLAVGLMHTSNDVFNTDASVENLPNLHCAPDDERNPLPTTEIASPPDVNPVLGEMDWMVGRPIMEIQCTWVSRVSSPTITLIV